MQTTLRDIGLAADQCAALRGDDARRQVCPVTQREGAISYAEESWFAVSRVFAATEDQKRWRCLAGSPPRRCDVAWQPMSATEHGRAAPNG